MNAQQFIKKNHITMTASYTDTNPHMDDSQNMDHWRVTLTARRNGRKAQMTTFFSMGYGHNGKEPEATDVLNCLASDAAGYQNARTFEDWASEYGYDTDSRKAEKIFKTVAKQAARLNVFLGNDEYNTLLWDVERL